MAPNHLFHKWGRGIEPNLPRITRAEDEFLVTAGGDRIIDAAAGAAVVNLGHSLDGITDVITSQIDQVAYVSLSHFTSAASERLAERLADRTPVGLEYVFPVNSGSEGVETAIKLARAYHAARGNGRKSEIIGRHRSYHGATLGALSAGGHTARRRGYEPLLSNWPKLRPAHPYRWPFDGTPEEQARLAAGELEALIRDRGPDRVAAFIAEPVGGASIPAARPHPAYYREVRRICDEYDVLFITDEVMTGFGRTGSMFAIERFDVKPDILVVGKGLSGGYAPIGATVISEAVAEPFESTSATFLHGHTFGGNPVSAAVAASVVTRYTPSVLETGRRRGREIVEGLDPIRDHAIVGDLRRAGAMIGIEFVRDRETADPFDPALRVADRMYEALLDRGVYAYPGTGCADGQSGDHLMIAPPLTVSKTAATRIARATVDAVRDVAADLPI